MKLEIVVEKKSFEAIRNFVFDNSAFKIVLQVDGFVSASTAEKYQLTIEGSWDANTGMKAILKGIADCL